MCLFWGWLRIWPGLLLPSYLRTSILSSVTADAGVWPKKKESASLARDAVERCAELGIACTLWPGDITNAGLPCEYALAAKVLKDLPASPFLVPGNHDHDPGAWKKTFGPRRGVYPLPGGGSVIAVDTSDQLLHEDDAQVLLDTLRRDGQVTVMTHYQLFPSAL